MEEGDRQKLNTFSQSLEVKIDEFKKQQIKMETETMVKHEEELESYKEELMQKV